jgi:hypothetical protein
MFFIFLYIEKKLYGILEFCDSVEHSKIQGEFLFRPTHFIFKSTVKSNLLAPDLTI